MKKSELKLRCDNAVNETRHALQLVYDSLNEGQKKQLIKAAGVKALFDRYGVRID